MSDTNGLTDAEVIRLIEESGALLAAYEPRVWLVNLKDVRALLAEQARTEPVAWVYWHPSDTTHDGPDTLHKKAVSRFTDDTRKAMMAKGWLFEPLYPASTAAQPLKAEQADLIDYLKGVYAFIESTSPAGYADEAFRLPSSATRNQRSLFDAITGDASGELSPAAGQDREARGPAGRIAGVEAEQAKDAAEDAELLDWLDTTNKRFKMGWKVGVAPAGNCSVQSVIFLGNSEPVTIRAAIRAARAAERKA